MTIKWLGHSCFLFTDANGIRMLTDPCDPATGYDIGTVKADAVTSSHAHHDHNYFAAAKNARVINEPGEHTVKGVKIIGFPTWHDDERGALRGQNIMYLFEMDGLRVMHAGDIGHLPDAATVKAIGRVDVLLTPVGGVYTIDAVQAKELIDALKPRIAVPMHYRCASSGIRSIAPVEDFLRLWPAEDVRLLHSSEYDTESHENAKIIVFSI